MSICHCRILRLRRLAIVRRLWHHQRHHRRHHCHHQVPKLRHSHQHNRRENFVAKNIKKTRQCQKAETQVRAVYHPIAQAVPWVHTLLRWIITTVIITHIMNIPTKEWTTEIVIIIKVTHGRTCRWVRVVGISARILILVLRLVKCLVDGEKLAPVGPEKTIIIITRLSSVAGSGSFIARQGAGLSTLWSLTLPSSSKMALKPDRLMS